MAFEKGFTLSARRRRERARRSNILGEEIAGNYMS